MRTNRAVAVLALSIAVASCKGACGSGSTGALDAAADAAAIDAAVAPPPRCTAKKSAGSLGAVLDVGEAVLAPDGFAIGILRDKNVFSVASVSADLTKVTFTDLGTAHHDALPPQPFVWQNAVYVAWLDSGELLLARVDGDKAVTIGREVVDLLTYSAKNPMFDLAAFDVATEGERGIVAWERTFPTRGEIDVATFTKSGIEHAAADAGGPFLAASPPSSDADSPRVAPRGDGWWIVWSARAPEPTVDSGIEGPGESPSYRWLEAAALDTNGVRIGDPKKLTPVQGHVAGFDLVTHAGAAELVGRDAEEAAVDEGTTLFRITLADKPSAVDPLASSGIGRAVPVVVGSDAEAWAIVPSTTDATELFPIFPDKRAASTEPLLKGARPLGFRRSGAGAEVLAVTLPEGQAGASSSALEADLEVLSCGR